jgi:hypothetical protein
MNPLATELRRYLDDAIAKMDNAVAERTPRAVVIKRENNSFADSDAGGEMDETGKSHPPLLLRPEVGSEIDLSRRGGCTRIDCSGVGERQAATRACDALRLTVPQIVVVQDLA